MGEQVKPITFDQINQEKINAIPDFVIKAFNNLIVKKINGRRAAILQNDAITEILKMHQEAGHEFPLTRIPKRS